MSIYVAVQRDLGLNYLKTNLCESPLKNFQKGNTKIKLLFVTGAPRSGTTYLGLELSKGLRTSYIHEPFNIDCSYKGMPRRNYFYPTENELSAFHDSMHSLITKQAKINTGHFKNDRFLQRQIKKILGSRGPYHYRLFKWNFFSENAIIKDPIGVFLTAELIEAHSIKAVLVYRDPVEFVGSTIKLGWHFNGEDLINAKEQILRKYGGWGHAMALQNCSTNVEAAAHTWCAINSFIIGIKNSFPNEAFLISQEELKTTPEEALERVRKFSEFNERPLSMLEIALHNIFNAITSSIVGVQKFKSNPTATSSKNYLNAHETRQVREICGDYLVQLDKLRHEQDGTLS